MKSGGLELVMVRGGWVKQHPIENIVSTQKEEDEISFIRAQNCCVCFVDIVDSTRITSSINNPEKVRKYYEIFLNTMAAIARNFGAKIIKNVGDCLLNNDEIWVAVNKKYIFEGQDGKQTLSELFDGRSQLIVCHFMFDPS